MPAKRRHSKQRLDRPAQLAAWRMYLSTGWDYFGDLRRIGLDERTVDMDVAEAAWSEFGAEIVAGFEPSSYRPEPWGLAAFGPP